MSKETGTTKGTGKRKPGPGRPTDEPKVFHIGCRLSDEDIRKLHKCTEVLNISTTEVIRRGIDKVYADLPGIDDPNSKKGSDNHEEKKTK